MSNRSSSVPLLKSLQSILTSSAIVASAIWFIAQGLTRPNANLSHTFHYGDFDSNDPASNPARWLRAEVKITNTGRRALRVKRHKHILRTVDPIPIDAVMKDNALLYFENRSRLEWPEYDRFMWGYKDDDRPDYQVKERDDLVLEAGESHTVYLDFVVDQVIRRVALESFIEGDQENHGWKLSSLFCLAHKTGPNCDTWEGP